MPPGADEHAAIPMSPGRRRYILTLLTLIYAVSSMDRQVMAVLAEPIRRDLALTDSQYGLLAGMLFAVFYTVCGIPLAWLADRANRVRIIASACALWSLFAASFGLAQSFLQLAVSRAGLAIGEAGSSPASYSILSDCFAPAARGRAIGIFSLGVPIGTAAAVAGAAWIGAAFGWRVAFFASAIPGIVLALVLLLTVAEPSRGALHSITPPTPLRVVLREYFTNPALALLTAATSLSIVAGYGVMMWAPAFLMRSGGMTLSQLGGIFAVGSGLALGIGMYGSGWLADRLASRGNVWAMAAIPAVSQVLAAAALALALISGRWEFSIWPVLAAMAFIASYFSPAMTLVQHSVTADRRAVAAAILLFFVGIFGGAGPLLVGWASDLAQARGPGVSLRIGLASVIPFFVLSSGLYWQAARVGVRRGH